MKFDFGQQKKLTLLDESFKMIPIIEHDVENAKQPKK